MITPTIYSTIIEQQDTDFTARASVTSIIAKILNVAGVDADSKGFGVGLLNNNFQSWVLSRFALELNSIPSSFETIDIKTWISDNNRLFSTRNFILYNNKGDIVGEAVSQWCVIDVNNRGSVELSNLPSTFSQYNIGSLDSTIDRPKKIPKLIDSVSYNHRAVYSDIDFNNHVNALRYIELMFNAISLDTIASMNIFRFDLLYQRECYYDDMLTINYDNRGDMLLFEVVKDGNKPAVKGMLELR